jgi:hypothetical protein
MEKFADVTDADTEVDASTCANEIAPRLRSWYNTISWLISTLNASCG